MKRLIPLLLLFACSEDDSTVFKIEDAYLQSRYDKFVTVASNLEVTVPKGNLVLSYLEDDNEANDSRAYKKGEQLHVEIDRSFLKFYCRDENQVEIVIFQQLANGLLGTPFRNCGMMRKITTPQDVPDVTLDYGDYVNLFDPSSPCSE